MHHKPCILTSLQFLFSQRACPRFLPQGAQAQGTPRHNPGTCRLSSTTNSPPVPPSEFLVPFNHHFLIPCQFLHFASQHNSALTKRLNKSFRFPSSFVHCPDLPTHIRISPTSTRPRSPYPTAANPASITTTLRTSIRSDPLIFAFLRLSISDTDTGLERQGRCAVSH